MSNYTKTTDFQAKDSLPTGNANKVVKGAEIDTEFNSIATAIATKANSASPTFTGTMTAAVANFSGNVTIGDAATDTVTVTADVASNLIPSADSTYALGDASNYWSNAYVDAVTTTGNVSVGGNLTVTGNATISGTLTFGDADTDSITLNAEIASDVIPDVDGTYDLGSATKEWQDLYIDGTANIDSLVADTADINSGTIDNTVIGGTTAVAGTFTTATATTGAITTVNSTTVNATTVDSTNVEVTNIKAKDGTASASIADATGVMTIASSVLTTADINGGSIDNATIGATTASTGNFSTLSIAGTAITSTATELNLLDGVTATTAEINYLDGVTSNIQTQLDSLQDLDADLTAIAALSSADGNFIVGSATGWVAESGDTAIASLGITATSTELNTLDGITATTAELNYTDGVTSNIQTQIDTKAPTASPTFTGTVTIPTADINGGSIDGTTIGATTASTGNFSTLSIGGTAITATAAELNALDGITATVTELNYTDGVTSAIQTQLDAKAPIDAATFTGTTTIPTADINGGTIDGVTIGGSSAAAGTFTTFTSTGIDDNASATAVTIDSSQNVGIGTASPDGTLHVYSGSAGAVTADASADDLVIEGSSTTGISILNPDNATGYFMFGSPTEAAGMYADWTYNTGVGRIGTNKVGATLALRADDTVTNLTLSGASGSELATFAGKVGIGTTSPSQLLHVAGSGNIAIKLDSTSTGGDAWRILSNDNTSSQGGGSLAFYNEDTATYAFKIDSSGYIYNPSMLGSASANSDVRFNTSDGLIYYQTSSRRYKENIQDLPSMLDKVNALRPVTFDEISTGESCYGLIAEEVFEQIPELVNLKEVEGYDEPQPDNIPYSMLSIFLLKAIQEQQTVINDLKARIETLEGA